MKKAWDYFYIAYLIYVVCAYIHSNPLLEAKMWMWFSQRCQNGARLLGEIGMGAELVAYDVVKQ